MRKKPILSALLISLVAMIFIGCVSYVTYEMRPIKGYISIVDGDTFWLNGEIIRLKDIDAPEHGQKGYTQAITVLNLMTFGEEVTCTNEGRDKYKRRLSYCTVNDLDISAVLAKECAAYGYQRYMNSECKFPFEEPSKYRRRQNSAFHMPLMLDEAHD
jgi:endonuclease YncB( thermonuclease family)